MPRSNQTKRLLAESLMDLMTTTPLEKISSQRYCGPRRGRAQYLLLSF